MVHLIQDYIVESARRAPRAPALSYQGRTLSYAELARGVAELAAALPGLGLARGERVAVYLEKRVEAVLAMFGAAAAGAVFVPVNPLLKPDQVAYILADCNVRILVTSPERLDLLGGALRACPDLHTVIVTGVDAMPAALPGAPGQPDRRLLHWRDCLAAAATGQAHPCIDSDMAAILYTSGSTGKPKGVVLSHRNLVAGAASVASYLGNTAQDRILCLLPLSFDYGLSQLTTAFASGACAVLMNYLLAREVPELVESEAITGLAAVPPLWMQLAPLRWPARARLRYVTNSGGAMPRATLDQLRAVLPDTQIYLMYGLTEAFRSTFLPPEQLAWRPGSIGKAIPNAEVLVLHPDGRRCAPGEAGELVHRGALVAMGYWNDAARTAERFKPLPPASSAHGGLPLAELAVWSGDTVRSDADGYLYFVGRADDMIKTSGYRVSPTEVEDVVYATGLVTEAAALGVTHPLLGQAVALVATAAPGATLDGARLLAACKAALPAYMLPLSITLRDEALPRNPNGKIDRPLLAAQLADVFHALRDGARAGAQ